MRSIVTIVLLIVFAVGQGGPSAGLLVPGDTASVSMTHAAMPAAQGEDMSHGLLDLLMACCDVEHANKTANTGKCTSHCAIMLPVVPELAKPVVVLQRAEKTLILRAAAPPVAEHPPRPV